MPSVEIQVGPRDGSRRIAEVTDEWLWTRIYESRDVGLAPRFGVQVRFNGNTFALYTPDSGEQIVAVQSECRFEQTVVDIWNRMGLNCADYTEGAAVSFVRHLRSMVEGRVQKTMLF